MRNFFRLVLFGLLISLCFSACRTSFTQSDLQYYQCYAQGQNLIFTNYLGLADTFLITRKLTRDRPWVPIFGDGWTRSVEAIVYFQPAGVKNNSSDWPLHYIIRLNAESIRSDYYFRGFMSDAISPEEAGVIKSDTLQIGRKIFPKYRVIQNELGPERLQPTDAEFLYFALPYGLVRYITHDGTVWNRKL